MTFSTRYGYDNQNLAEAILEDAPSWLRLGYIKILEQFTYTDDDSRYENSDGRPLGTKYLNEKICIKFCRESESSATDSWGCNEFLRDLVKSCEWYQFYDFIEIIGKEIKSEEKMWRESPKASEYSDRIERFGFGKYLYLINDLFTESNVAWKMDEDGILTKSLPQELSQRLESINEEIQDTFESAHTHYLKAVKYSTVRPIDPENSIKEITCAIESIGRVMYPKTSTLGNVVNEMKRQKDLPKHLVSVIEKFYTYACDEPSVRHGNPVTSSVLIDDAEFCLHVGAAIIRYLIASYKKRHPENNQSPL